VCYTPQEHREVRAVAVMLVAVEVVAMGAERSDRKLSLIARKRLLLADYLTVEKSSQ